MVSMPSIHFYRWTEQLKDSKHEVFWFDILGNGKKSERLNWVKQFVDWKLKLNYPGRYFLKKKFPGFYKKMQEYNENKTANEFEKVLNEIKPDVVHSFVMYVSCVPIFDVMQQHKNIKWIYSAWGNDLYFYQNHDKHKQGIDNVLPKIDYMFADCERDLALALKLGFKGKILGNFPGGGGYHLDMIDEEVKKIEDRTCIIVKGYHGEKHRGLQVLKALEMIDNFPKVILFSADDVVFNYYKTSEGLLTKDITIYRIKEPIAHKELCKLMNQSLIYVGNNLSDGIPNTLLEAICFGAFPIQSNPGGASAEIVEDGKNGFLIENCEDVNEIKLKIEKALSNKALLLSAFKINMELRNTLEYHYIKTRVLKKYDEIEYEIYHA